MKNKIVPWAMHKALPFTQDYCMPDSYATRTKLVCFKKHTSWFADAARPPIASEPYIIGPFGMLLVIATPSTGICVEGVDSCEFDEPTVFPVPVLLFYQRQKRKLLVYLNPLTN